MGTRKPLGPATRRTGALDLLRVLGGPTPYPHRSAVLDRQTALREAIAWLHQSQDADPAGGIQSFGVARGWVPSAASVTADVLLAHFDHARVAGDPSSFDRGVRMAQGVLGSVDRRLPAPSDDSVLRGMLRAGRETGDPRYLDASNRLADRLAQAQRGGATPSPGVIEALLEAWVATGETAYRDAAHRGTQEVLGRQRDNGWFPADPGEAGHGGQWTGTGTLAAVVADLSASAAVAADPEASVAARSTADAMVRRFEIDRVLWSRYDERWRGHAPRARTEDQGRVALAWLALAVRSANPWYLNAALKLNDDLCARQLLHTSAPVLRGAVVEDRGWRAASARLLLRSETAAIFCRSLLAEPAADLHRSPPMMRGAAARGQG